MPYTACRAKAAGWVCAKQEVWRRHTNTRSYGKTYLLRLLCTSLIWTLNLPFFQVKLSRSCWLVGFHCMQAAVLFCFKISKLVPCKLARMSLKMLLLTGASAPLPQIPMPWQFTLVITTASHPTFFVLSRTKGNSRHYKQLLGKAGGSLKQRAPGGSRTALEPIPFPSARAWGSGTARCWCQGFGSVGQQLLLVEGAEGNPPRSRSPFPSSLLPPSCCPASVTAAAPAPASLHLHP